MKRRWITLGVAAVLIAVFLVTGEPLFFLAVGLPLSFEPAVLRWGTIGPYALARKRGLNDEDALSRSAWATRSLTIGLMLMMIAMRAGVL